MIRFLPLLLGATLTLGPLATPTPEAPAAEEADTLLRQVAQHYAELGDLAGTFVQSYTNRALGRTMEEHGRMLIAPPDNMRWEYLEPENKLFVSRKDQAWFYLPEDNMVYRVSLDGQIARRLPSRLMSGDETLVQEFEPVSVEEQEDELLRLTLRPRVPDEGIETLALVLLRPQLDIQAIEVTDSLGNRTVFRFPELNPVDAIDDVMFTFTPPQGVEVVDEG